MNLRAVTPLDTKRLMDGGAILIDIREADEHARERIPGARHIALSKMDEADIAVHRGQTVIFHCRSGARTRSNSARLAAKAGDTCEGYLLDGGLDAWRNAGLRTIVDRRQPIELQRQVQIGAGGLALLGTLLGLTFHNCSWQLLYSSVRDCCSPGSPGFAAWRACCSGRPGTGQPIRPDN